MKIMKLQEYTSQFLFEYWILYTLYKLSSQHLGHFFVLLRVSDIGSRLYLNNLGTAKNFNPRSCKKPKPLSKTSPFSGLLSTFATLVSIYSWKTMTKFLTTKRQMLGLPVTPLNAHLLLVACSHLQSESSVFS